MENLERTIVEWISVEYEKFRNKIGVELQSDWQSFKVEFLDRDSFKVFSDNLLEQIGGWTEIGIAGYFSETIRESLERIIETGRKLRLICQELDVNDRRDRKNLDVLKRLCLKGVEIKINNRLHARFLVAYRPDERGKSGVLVLGSFDFNTECLGKERYDAGVKTMHPDLVNSAIDLFEEIWNDPESTPFIEKYPVKKAAAKEESFPELKFSEEE